MLSRFPSQRGLGHYEMIPAPAGKGGAILEQMNQILSVELDDPRRTGIFTVRDAALYFRATVRDLTKADEGTSFGTLTARHLHRWVQDWSSQTALPATDRVVSFLELVRLRMIYLMRLRGIGPDVIRKAEERAKDLTQSSNPFATSKMWSLSSNVYLEVAHFIVYISHRSDGPQLAHPSFIPELIPLEHGLSFDPQDDEATEWHPSDGVVINPRLQFGAPCVAGTRIETEVLASLVRAGETTESLAAMYDISIHKIVAALGWEHLLSKVA
jgi:uncharacterized protein (DUF433 family)